ncbi:hypothetical protein [Proteus mirabilis]|uniref:hypothetical protein n=1 Tax=Proteus mirabilis TaxID=584 RepID=UPI0034D7599A
MNSLLTVAGTIFLIIIAINIISFIAFYIKNNSITKTARLGDNIWSVESNAFKRFAGLAKTRPVTNYSQNELINALKLYVNTFNTSVNLCNSVGTGIQTTLQIKDYDIIDDGDDVVILITPNNTNIGIMQVVVNKGNTHDFVKFVADHINAIDLSVKTYMEKYRV